MAYVSHLNFEDIMHLFDCIPNFLIVHRINIIKH